MKILKLVFLLIPVLITIPAYAQTADPKRAAGIMTEDFEAALQNDDISAFVNKYMISDAGLQELVEQENRAMGLTDDDPGSFTMMQANELTGQMSEKFIRSFNTGLESLEIISGINPADLLIRDFTVNKSYWQPPVAEISIYAAADGTELVISLSNISVSGEELYLGPSSRLEFSGYQPQDRIAYYIIEALKRQDALFYADSVLPDLDGFIAILEASTESGEFHPGTDSAVLLGQIREKIIADFDNLIETGIRKGIVWRDIDNVWAGYSAGLQGGIYQSSIPFEFSCKGKQFRIVLEYCTQLASDLTIFLPGEFVWQ